MPGFPAVFQLSSLDGTNGFRLEAFIGRSSEMEECFMYFFFVVYLWSLASRLKFRSGKDG